MVEMSSPNALTTIYYKKKNEFLAQYCTHTHTRFTLWGKERNHESKTKETEWFLKKIFYAILYAIVFSKWIAIR